ncbi:MAG: hypothetical protein RMJ56_17130 [Gemmataceae bacterium]|nr:hypothetical protein [Gemmata sp.]MDW8199321.1 hypothetical protein [Gemmataceae bacterium]
MLTEQQLALITAAIDRELSDSEMAALQQLLSVSAEAQQLYAQLADDSRRLQSLSGAAIPVPAELTARIVTRIATLPTLRPLRTTALPSTSSSPSSSQPSRRRIWQHLVPVAMAASVLLAITLTSFVFFSQTERLKTRTRILAQKFPSPTDAPIAPQQLTPQPSTTPPLATGDKPPASPPVSPMPKEVEPQPSVTLAPEPRIVARDLIGSQILPALPPFERVEVRVPLLRPVAELPQDDVRQLLLDELKSSLATRFDLFVRDPSRGVDVLEKAATATGLKLYVDSATRDKLKKKQIHSVVFFTDNLTPSEVVKFLAQIALEDQKFSPRVCDSIHALPAGRLDEMELKSLLGSDPGLFRRPSERTDSGSTSAKAPAVPQGKALSDQTIDKVTETLTKPAERGREKSAVLLTWQTIHPSIPRTAPAASAELKQFLQKQGERDPRSSPILIVIRPVG